MWHQVLTMTSLTDGFQAMPRSDSQPTPNVSVAGFVAGVAGGVITPIAPKACRARLQKRNGGRHTASSAVLRASGPFRSLGKL